MSQFLERLLYVFEKRGSSRYRSDLCPPTPHLSSRPSPPSPPAIFEHDLHKAKKIKMESDANMQTIRVRASRVDTVHPPRLAVCVF